MSVTLPALRVTASSLVTGCGVGWRAHRAALREERTGLRRNDFAPAARLDTWIGRVDAVDSVAVARRFAQFDCRNSRLAQLVVEQDGFMRAVAAASARYGKEGIGLFVGTSTSGILSTELSAREHFGRSGAVPLDAAHYRNRHNMYATAEFLRSYLDLAGPSAVVSTACSSSAKAFAMAQRAIAASRCAAAVVAGVDSLSMSTLNGFHSLQLLSRNACRPFGAERDGISIGEGAGVALLDPKGEGAVAFAGAGETSDAHHMSSPAPGGEGAARAMREAMHRAGLLPADIGYVNLHGTGTAANDAAEDRAVSAVFGSDAWASSTKGWTGHTLGAAGIVEALLTVDSIERQWLPRTLGPDRVDPAFRSKVLMASVPARIRCAMSNSFGFGGSNCSLVFARDP